MLTENSEIDGTSARMKNLAFTGDVLFFLFVEVNDR
jgi:hypothetical protein